MQVGMLAFADELRDGSLPALATLRLDSNALGERSMRSLGRALASGSMARLTTLDLAGNQIRDAGLMALMREACERGKALMHLMHLDVSSNRIGKGGRAAAHAAAPHDTRSQSGPPGSPPLGATRGRELGKEIDGPAEGGPGLGGCRRRLAPESPPREARQASTPRSQDAVTARPRGLRSHAMSGWVWRPRLASWGA